MSHINPRARRIAEQIRAELADILRRELKDPRVHDVTLTSVEVTSDLEHAKVWFTLLTGDRDEVRKALGHAAGFLRTELSHRMRLRSVPKLVFAYDESVERGAYLSELIDRVVAEDKQHPQDDETQG
ncbi:MAG TPA: 30S ribosome-binding factor RbfA [Thiobacillaceae bacterium]|nr:30S ribosome-binding factor RbfA [Thiobacillaceae bacterium]